MHGAKRILMVAQAFACSAVLAITTTSVPEKTYSKKLTVVVSSDTDIETALVNAGAQLSDLTGNVYDCLEKMGDGTLTVDRDISSFTGDIYIEGGVFSATAVTSLGAESGEDMSFIVVRKGATLDYAAEDAWTTNKKTVYAEGTGPSGGSGFAVQFSPKTSSAQGHKTYGWGKNLILTGDAAFGQTTDRSFQDFRSADSVYLNGHRLTLDFDSSNNRFELRVRDAFTSSSVYIKTANIVYFQKSPTSGSAANRLIFGSGVREVDLQASPANWTYVIEDAAKTTLLCQEANKHFAAPLVVEKGQLVVKYGTDGHYFEMNGGIAGQGGLLFDGGTHASTNKISAVNSFGGVLGVNASTVLVPTSGSIPATAAAVALTNSVIEMSALVSQSLPPIVASGESRMALPDLAHSVRSISVPDGALAFSSGSGEIKMVPGLFFGEDVSQNWFNTYKDNLASCPVLTNGLDSVELGLTLANTKIDGASGSFYTYSGYVMNTNTTPVTWLFFYDTLARGHLTVNRTSYKQSSGTDHRRVVKVLLNPGANSIVFRGLKNGSNSGPFTGETIGGFMIYRGADAAGITIPDDSTLQTWTSTDPVVWELPVDPGDGSLFRVAVDAAEAKGLGFETSWLTVGDLNVPHGSSVDFGGRAVIVTNLTGSGNIQNCDVVQVEETFAPDVADLAAANVMSVSGSVRFTEGAEVVVNGKIKAGRYELLTAEQGVSGMPTLKCELKDAKLEMSADGKTLLLIAQRHGLVLLFR